MADVDLSRERAFFIAAKVAAGQVGAYGGAGDVVDVMPLLAGFEARLYAAGDTILWEDGLPYSAIRAVDAKVHPDWTPAGAVSEWKAWHATDAAHALPYRMRNATDAYMTGEFVRWVAEGAEGVYRCLADNTVWNPEEQPTRWERVGGAANVPDVPQPPEEPPVQYPEWKQPTGSHDAYAIGAKVTYGGKLWENTASANAYPPGVYGWKEIST